MKTNQYRIHSVNNAKISHAFREISNLVTQVLDKVSSILSQVGIKYFSRPSHQMLMRLLTPQQLKVYIDMTDVCCLFENRSQIIKANLQKINLMQNSFYSPKFQNAGSIDKLFMNKNTDQIGYNRMYNINGFTQKQKANNMDPNPQHQIKNNEYSVSKKIQKKMVAQMVTNQLIQWVKTQIQKGMSVTRHDVFQKVKEFAQAYNMRIGGQRWFKSFLRKHSHIKAYLTHGNSVKKNGLKMNKKQIETKKQQQQSNYESQNEQDSSNSSQYSIQQHKDYNLAIGSQNQQQSIYNDE